MIPAFITYPIYNLANTHFEKIEVLTKDGKLMKGQFVEFKVLKGVVEYLYPSEKYCFLPEEKRKAFWEAYAVNNGEFTDFPEYIKLMSLSDIKKIVIYPVLVA
jgi:tellurite resistance-related uncharacterized protein